MNNKGLDLISIHVPFANAVVFAAILWASGCGKQPAIEDSASNDPTAQSGNNVDDASADNHSVRPLRLGSDLSIAEIDGDSWDTEKFSAQTDTQLKTIAKLYSDAGKIRSDQLTVVVPDFSGFVPAADAMTPVYQTRHVRVQRPTTDTPTNRLSGRDGLARWLNSLASANAKAGTSHLKFKTFGVAVTQRHILTTVWMQMDHRSADSFVQCSATWKCRWRASTDSAGPRLDELTIVDLERVTLDAGEPLFADCTEPILGQNDSYHEQLAYGLNHWLNRLELYDGIVATSYHGLAVGDVNNDGLEDVYLCQPGGAAGGLPNRLFIQQDDGTAVDVSAESGTDWLLETHSALLVDLDNDGDQDLVAATIAGLIFAENDGQARFEPRRYKLTPEAPAISIAAADFDHDGDLDVYACSYGRRAAEELMGRPIPYHDANNGARNVLFRNDRDWRFTNVTRQVGLETNNRRFSLACAWEDYDNDGDQDLYVANDFGRNNLYQNNNGQFVDVAASARVEDMSAGMSVAWGDYDNDGRMDLYVSNMWSSAGNRIAYQRRFLTPNTDPRTLAGFQRHARGNSLFRNVTNAESGLFSDVSQAAHVTIGRWAWSSQFVDINNDGWEDLVVANGYITQDDPHDL